MTPLEELDLARAKAMAHAGSGAKERFTPDDVWGQISQSLQDIYLVYARATRLSDEARGLRVAPVKLLDKCGNNSMNCPHAPTMKAWLSASPYAPEEK